MTGKYSLMFTIHYLDGLKRQSNKLTRLEPSLLVVENIARLIYSISSLKIYRTYINNFISEIYRILVTKQ